MKELIDVINENCALKLELQQINHELTDLLAQTCNMQGIEIKALDQLISLEDENQQLRKITMELQRKLDETIGENHRLKKGDNDKTQVF